MEPATTSSVAQSTRSWLQSKSLLVYSILAVFSLFTVATALYFQARVTKVFDESVAVNRQWARGQQYFSRLVELAGQLNRPGNDIFLSRNAPIESDRLEAAHVFFKSYLPNVSKHLRGNLGPAQAAPFLLSLQNFEETAAVMVEHARMAITQFDKKKPVAAAEEVAAMNQSYHEMNALLSHLQQRASLFQEDHFKRQAEALDSMRNAQRTIMVLTVLMIAGAVFYGALLARKLESDARERKEHIARLQEAEERVRSIFENAADGIFQTTPDGRFLAANPSLANMHGFKSPEDLIQYASGSGGQAGRRLLVDPDQSEEFLRKLEEQGSVGGFETKIHRRDGTTLWVAINARAVRDAGGNSLYYEGFVHDITNRKEMDQMKSDFVSFATHQLRTPLSGIKWLLELAVDNQALSEETLSYIQDARGSTDRLITLVNDLLDISRLEGGKIKIECQEIHLGELTRNIVEEMAPLIKERQHQLSVNGVEQLPPVFVDPQLMRQVILNLVSNAVKYTLPPGEIKITADQEENEIRWSIKDNGVGVPKQAQARLFEKFFRADNVIPLETEGTGLGLYMIRLIIERFGGRVWCESREGEGAMFTFTLPLQGA